MTHVARASLGAFLLAGCLESQTPPDGDVVVPWAICDDALASGSHMDPCSFDDGSECMPIEPPYRAAQCRAGRLLLVDVVSEVVEGGEIPACTGWASASASTAVLLAVEGSCFVVGDCEPSNPQYPRTLRVCQSPPQTGVRAGASEWGDCQLALQSGTDGDACTGEFNCLGARSLGGSTTANDTFVWCSNGVLRIAPMRSVYSFLEG